jgi:ficolin
MKLTALSVALVLIVGGAAAGEQSKAGCGLTWTKYGDFGTPGLVLVSAKTEEDCKSVCQAKSDCWSLDWNYLNNACHLGTTQNPAKNVATGVNHWDLSCAAPTGIDCGDIHRKFPSSKSGVYSIILPDRKEPLPVYCDMDTAYGGWTVIQRRKDGSVDFERNWPDYAHGFGNLTGEFWLGNEYLTDLTNAARSYRLRFDMENWAGRRSYAEYNNFKVGAANTKYKLTFDQCSYFGTAGDAIYDGHNINGMKFTTKDQDNDNRASESCSKRYKGAWWYNDCHWGNPNGQYNNTNFAEGITWIDQNYSLKFMEIKIRGPDL